jgi:aminopeptidase N
LDAEHHISGKLRFSRQQRREDTAADQLLMDCVGFDVFGIKLDGSRATPQPAHRTNESIRAGEEVSSTVAN